MFHHSNPPSAPHPDHWPLPLPQFTYTSAHHGPGTTDQQRCGLQPDFLNWNLTQFSVPLGQPVRSSTVQAHWSRNRTQDLVVVRRGCYPLSQLKSLISLHNNSLCRTHVSLCLWPSSQRVAPQMFSRWTNLTLFWALPLLEEHFTLWYKSTILHKCCQDLLLQKRSIIPQNIQCGCHFLFGFSMIPVLYIVYVSSSH